MTQVEPKLIKSNHSIKLFKMAQKRSNCTILDTSVKKYFEGSLAILLGLSPSTESS